MNLGEYIVTALSSVGLPIEPGTFTDTHDTYIIYSYDERPTFYADNQPQYTKFLVQVHLIAPPGKYTYGFRKSIKSCLIDSGFTHPVIIGGADVSKTGGGEQHFIFECEFVAPEEVGADG